MDKVEQILTYNEWLMEHFYRTLSPAGRERMAAKWGAGAIEERTTKDGRTVYVTNKGYVGKRRERARKIKEKARSWMRKMKAKERDIRAKEKVKIKEYEKEKKSEPVKKEETKAEKKVKQLILEIIKKVQVPGAAWGNDEITWGPAETYCNQRGIERKTFTAIVASLVEKGILAIGSTGGMKTIIWKAEGLELEKSKEEEKKKSELTKKEKAKKSEVGEKAKSAEETKLKEIIDKAMETGEETPLNYIRTLNVEITGRYGKTKGQRIVKARILELAKTQEDVEGNKETMFAPRYYETWIAKDTVEANRARNTEIKDIFGEEIIKSAYETYRDKKDVSQARDKLHGKWSQLTGDTRYSDIKKLGNELKEKIIALQKLRDKDKMTDRDIIEFKRMRQEARELGEKMMDYGSVAKNMIEELKKDENEAVKYNAAEMDSRLVAQEEDKRRGVWQEKRQREDIEAYRKLKDRGGTNIGTPDLPESWNHYKKEYAAILTEENGRLNRKFLGERTEHTSSGANASIEYNENEQPENMEVGTVLEVKSGSHKNMYYRYYRKHKAGWLDIGSRSGSSGYFGGGREPLSAVVKD